MVLGNYNRDSGNHFILYRADGAKRRTTQEKKKNVLMLKKKANTVTLFTIEKRSSL